MKGLPLTKSVLLALTLLLPATHGRAFFRRQQRQQQDPGYQTHYGRGGYSRQDGLLYGRLPYSYKTHVTTSDLLQLFQSLNPRLDPLDAGLEDPLLSNDLDQNLGGLDQEEDREGGLAVSPESLDPYTTHRLDTHQQNHGWDHSRHHGHKTYNEEVCSTQKGWNVVKESVDLDGNAVVIIQVEGERNQTYYGYKCEKQCQSCKNVMGASMCKQRFTYVYLYHHLKHNPTDMRWGFVEVPSHCACELVSPNSRDPECGKNY